MLHRCAVWAVAIQATRTGRHRVMLKLPLANRRVATPAELAGLFDEQFGLPGIVRAVATDAACLGGRVRVLQFQLLLDRVVAGETELIAGGVYRTGILRIGVIVARTAIFRVIRIVGADRLLVGRQRTDSYVPSHGGRPSLRRFNILAEQKNNTDKNSPPARAGKQIHRIHHIVDQLSVVRVY